MKRYYNPTTKEWYTEGNSITKNISNGVFSGIPSVEQLESWGFEEWHEPTPTPEELLARAKSAKIAELEAYDASEVNSFSVDGKDMWLDHDLRQQLRISLDALSQAGRETVTKWFDGERYAYPIDVWYYMLGLVGTERTNFLILQDTQEFHLSVQRHIANFVEEDGAAVGCLKKTDAFVLSTRECSTGVSEKFAFEKVVGNGAAIDGYELFVHATDGAGDEFLTYAGFALNEHGARMHDGALYGFAELFHGLAFTYQVAHAFPENLTGGMDVLELCDLRHQVEFQGFHRKNAVVKLVGYFSELLGRFGINKNQGVRRFFAERLEHLQVMR